LLLRSGLASEHYAEHTWYVAVGCPHCSGTGYRGRAAIAELLDLSPAMRELILERRPITQLKEAAAREGMRSLRQAALARALAGDTTLHEINRVTFVD
jgi:type II secretory ATPase GspE/PulE/Tfp pilus assembly ATPase PilB-like protein